MALKTIYGSEPLERITITKGTKRKIIKLANKKNLKQITVLEYLPHSFHTHTLIDQVLFLHPKIFH